jgi:hypothetical protein
VKFFAEKDPPISTDNEMLSNNIQRFKDGYDRIGTEAVSECLVTGA